MPIRVLPPQQIDPDDPKFVASAGIRGTQPSRTTSALPIGITEDDVAGPGRDAYLEFRQGVMDKYGAGSSGQLEIDPERPILRVLPPEREHEEYGWGIKAAFQRGLERLSALPDIATGDYDELAEHYSNLENYALSAEDQARYEELESKEGFWESIGYFLRNPSLIAQVTVESLPMSAGILATGAAGAIGGTLASGGNPLATAAGTAAGAFAGSYGTEYFNVIADTFAKNDVDLTDPAALKAAFKDASLMAKARESASNRAIPIAVFDALSFGVAGRLAAPVAKAARGTVGRSLGLGGATELTAQMGAGALGEAGAQISDEGRITSMSEVAAEAVGELLPGAVEIGIGRLTRRGQDTDTDTNVDPDTGVPKDITAALGGVAYEGRFGTSRLRATPEGAAGTFDPLGGVPQIGGATATGSLAPGGVGGIPLGLSEGSNIDPYFNPAGELPGVGPGQAVSKAEAANQKSQQAEFNYGPQITEQRDLFRRPSTRGKGTETGKPVAPTEPVLLEDQRPAPVKKAAVEKVLGKQLELDIGKKKPKLTAKKTSKPKRQLPRQLKEEVKSKTLVPDDKTKGKPGRAVGVIAKALNNKRSDIYPTVFNTKVEVDGQQMDGHDALKKALGDIAIAVSNKASRKDKATHRITDVVGKKVKRIQRELDRLKSMKGLEKRGVRDSKARKVARDIINLVSQTRGIITAPTVADAYINQLLNLPSRETRSATSFLKAITEYADEAISKVPASKTGEATGFMGLQTETELRDFLGLLEVKRHRGVKRRAGKLYIRDKKKNKFDIQVPVEVVANIEGENIYGAQGVETRKRVKAFTLDERATPETSRAPSLMSLAFHRRADKSQTPENFKKIHSNSTKQELIDFIVDSVKEERRQVRKGGKKRTRPVVTELETKRRAEKAKKTLAERKAAKAKPKPAKKKTEQPSGFKKRKEKDKAIERRAKAISQLRVYARLERDKSQVGRRGRTLEERMLPDRRKFRGRFLSMKYTNLRKIMVDAGFDIKGRPSRETLVDMLDEQFNKIIKLEEGSLYLFEPSSRDGFTAEDVARYEGTYVPPTTEQKQRSITKRSQEQVRRALNIVEEVEETQPVDTESVVEQEPLLPEDLTAADIAELTKQVERGLVTSENISEATQEILLGKAERRKTQVELALAVEFEEFVKENPTSEEFKLTLKKSSDRNFETVPRSKDRVVRVLKEASAFLKRLDSKLNQWKVPFGFSLHTTPPGMMVPSMEIDMIQADTTEDMRRAGIGKTELDLDKQGIGGVTGIKRVTLLKRLQVEINALVKRIERTKWTKATAHEYLFARKHTWLRKFAEFHNVPAPDVIKKGRGDKVGTKEPFIESLVPHLMAENKFLGWGVENKKAAGSVFKRINDHVPSVGLRATAPEGKALKPGKHTVPINLDQSSASEYSSDYADLGGLIRLLFNDGGATSDAVNLNSILDFVSVGEGTHVEWLVQKIRNLNLEVGVQLSDDVTTDAEYNSETRRINISREAFNDTSPAQMGHLFLHEGVHAATLHALRTNVKAAREMEALFNKVRPKLKGSYGTTNVAEFVAEVFTNPEFRAELETIRVPNKRGMLATAKDWFVNVIRSALGLSTEFNNALNEAVGIGEQLFVTEDQIQDMTNNPRKYGDLMTSSSAPFIRDALALAKDYVVHDAADVVRSKGLGFMSGRQIADWYHDVMTFVSETGEKISPLHNYQRLIERKESFVHALRETGSIVNTNWNEVKSNHSEQHDVMVEFMVDSTFSHIHGDVPFNHKLNAHVKDTKRNRATHARLQKQWRRMEIKGKPSNEQYVQELYRTVRDYYKKNRDSSIRYIAENIYAIYDIDQNAEDVISGKLSASKLTSNNKPLDTNAVQALNALTAHQKLKGPYFPLMRFGDFVVTATAEQRMTATTQEELETDLKEYLGTRYKNTDLSNRTQLRDGTWQQTFEERVFGTFEGRLDAKKRIREMQAQPDVYSSVSPRYELKNNLINTAGANMPSIQFLQSVLNKVDERLVTADDKKKQEITALASAMKQVFLEMLPETSMRKTELKRQNILGFSKDMQRVFANRVSASAHYLGQLKYGQQLASQMRDMRQYTETNNEDGLKVVRQRVLNELRLRDVNEGKLTSPQEWIGRVSDVGFLWFLTSPSYWFVNSTQPYMLTLPYLAARYGPLKAGKAMTRAYREIMPEAMKRSLTSKFGLEGLRSMKTEQDIWNIETLIKSFRDPQSKRNKGLSEKQVKANQGKADMLEYLSRQNLLEISFAATLHEEARGLSTGIHPWSSMMDMARTMPHIVEVMNRTVTGIATYELALQKTKSHTKAQEAAAKAVAKTQFDYSAANKPRYMSSRTFAGLGPLMMFKQHSQHVYMTFITNIMNISDKAKRKQAFNEMAFILFTHASMAGVIGATFEPIKWAIGALAWAASEDEPWDYERAVRKVATKAFGPRFGELVAQGPLSRLAGAELTGRTGLHNLLFFGARETTPYDRNKFQNIMAAALGPLGAIPISFWNGRVDWAEGDYLRGMEKMTPKLLRDSIRVARLSREGLTDSTGNVMLDSKDITPLDFFLQSMGVNPSKLSEQYAAKTAFNRRDRALKEKRTQLMETYRRSSNKPAVWRNDIVPFSRKYPEYGIAFIQLMMSERERRRRQTQGYKGLYADRKQRRALRETADIYNLED